MSRRQRDIKEALSRGAIEITTLRHENQMLAIKAQGFDAFCILMTLLVPPRSGAMAPDAVYIMRKLLAEIEADEKKDETE